MVSNETKEMQEVIEKELGLEPVEQEVVVLYKGERTKQPEEFWNVNHYNFIIYYCHIKYL